MKTIIAICLSVLLCLLALKLFGQANTYGWNCALIGNNGAGIYYNGVWMPTVRSGRVSTALGQVTQAISFTSPMPDANYSVFMSGSLGSAALLTSSSKSSNGFTINISIAFSGVVDYIAVEDQP